jgi:CNT family concentrative nucleoside transporter
VIASYGLCGFANFGSLAILIGGMGGMAPSRRGEIAALGMRSILAGTLASLLTGSVAGLFL